MVGLGMVAGSNHWEMPRSFDQFGWKVDYFVFSFRRIDVILGSILVGDARGCSSQVGHMTITFMRGANLSLFATIFL